MYTKEIVAMRRQSERAALHFHIFVSDPFIVQVACNGRLVDNWQELQEQAWKAVQPFVKARWSMHWLAVQETAEKALRPNASLTDLLPCLCIVGPSTAYPCPPWLAELAVINTDMEVRGWH